MARNASSPGLPKYFELVSAPTTVARQLGQHAPGIPFAIHTARIGHHRQPGNLVAESQRDIAVLVVTIPVEPRSHRIHFEIRGIGRPISYPGNRQSTSNSRRDS